MSNLVINSGFETGDFTGWTLSGYDSAPKFNGVDYGVDASDAHSGSYGAYLGAFGGVLDLSQALTTTPGTTYDISFWLAQSTTPTALYLNSFSADFGSSTLTSLSQVPVIGYTEFSVDAIAAGALTNLTFAFRNDLDFFSIDDVSVSPVAATATPEPAAVSLVMVALLFQFLLRFLRQLRIRS